MYCPHYDAGSCRSCTELSRPYAWQLAAKAQHLRATLAAWPDIEWLPSVTSTESGFRNKAKMVVSGSVDAPLLGITDAQGRGVDLGDCALYSPALQAVFPTLRAFITQTRLTPYDVAARRGELKFLLLTLSPQSELMLRIVLRSEEALPRIRKQLPSLLEALPQLRVVSANLQPEHKAILEGEREIALTPQQSLRMAVNDRVLQLRPQSFFQTNTEVAAALYRQAREWVDEVQPRNVWDLYCGVGGFALHVATPGRHVTGIEISREAIASAEQSRDDQSADNPGLRDVTFRALDATGFALADTQAPELVIVNPPRRGIGAELCAYLENSAAQTVIYSSCNAESLARDLQRMPSLKPQRARLLDMFPHTTHYESIVLLQKDRQ